MKDYSGWTLFGIIAFIALILIFGPAICFLFGWISGWLAKITIGGVLCKGLNTLFGVTFFNPNQLPLVAGTLAWIGGFFKGVSTVKNN